MTEITVLFVLVAFFCICAGIVIGVKGAEKKADGRIKEAFAAGQKQAEADKQQLAGQIGNELMKIRESLNQTISAYDSAVLRVTESLGEPARIDQKRIEGPKSEQLQLELQQNEYRPRQNIESPAIQLTQVHEGDVQETLAADSDDDDDPRQTEIPRTDTVALNGGRVNGTAQHS